MRQKKSQSLPSSETKPRWISVDLTDRQKADMKGRFSTSEVIDDALLKLIESGYKVTLSYDTYSSCFACYLFPVGDEHMNAGHILSNRGASPKSALRGALYRHFVVFDGVWGNREAQDFDQD